MTVEGGTDGRIEVSADKRYFPRGTEGPFDAQQLLQQLQTR